MKKVYGRYSYKPKRKIELSSLLGENQGNVSKRVASSLDIEFSDDEEKSNGDQILVENSQSSILNNANTSMFSGALDSSPELDSAVADTVPANDPLNGLLDFLVVPAVKARKPKRLKSMPAASADIDPMEFNIDQTLDNVNLFIQSLQSQEFEDDQNVQDLKQEKHQNNDLDNRKKFKETDSKQNTVYGSLRSMLRSKSERTTSKEEEEENNDTDPERENETSDANRDSDDEDSEADHSDLPLTQNFNQLKTMGSNIQYQQDLQYMMDGHVSSDKKLLTLIREISTSNGLRSYITNYYSEDFIGSFGGNDDVYLISVLRQLVGVYKNLDIQFFKSLFDYQLRTDLDKYYQKQYSAIVEKYGFPEQLALGLLDYVPPMRKSAIISDKIISEKLLTMDLSDSLFKLIIHIEMGSSICSSGFLNKCVNSFEQYIENMDFIKFFINITNTKCEDGVPNLKDCLDLSLRYVSKHFQDSLKQDLIILHLGLCSNILSSCNDSLGKVPVTYFQNIVNSLNLESLNFMENLLILNHASLLKLAGNEINTDLKECLGKWVTEIKELNNSFYFRAMDILNIE